jgi:hypothetical protein
VPLVTADGQQIDVDAGNIEFARAMRAPEPDEPTAKAPPRKPPADPDAPKPKRGRPPKDAQPRTTAAKPSAPLAAKDYSPALQELAVGAWVCASAVKPLKAHAALWRATSAPMVDAWNVAANKNAVVRQKVEKLTTGEGGTWILGVAMASIPFAFGALELLRDKDKRAELAQANDAEFDKWIRVNMPGAIPEDEA